MVPVRDAATVILLRDGVAGVEAWLLQRHPQMAFAAGMTVFPGGRVDAADADLPWAGRPARAFASQLGCDEPTARALVGAAAREVFEETGVLLTRPVVAAPDPAAVAGDIEAGHRTFADLLNSLDVRIDADTLRPWAHWVTPPGEVARRYDTRFFVAALPFGAEPADLTTESTVADWIRVVDVVAEYERGERPMLPPTVMNLRSLLPFDSVRDVLAAAESLAIEPIHPIMRDGFVELPDGTTVDMP